jgi:hypothetical protein
LTVNRNVRAGGSSCSNTKIRQNSQLAVDLIPAWPGELLTLARILVVDDDVAVQMTVRLLLERAGGYCR